VKLWTAFAVALILLFFALALSDAVYEATSPSSFEWHVLLRKTYSIVAFAIVGAALERAAREWDRSLSLPATMLAVALFSAAIEIGQALTGSHEGLLWNLIDVACGAFGGALAWLADRRLIKR
jgi:surface polysaccharide O-acyltransferase-like enzyme